MRAVEAILVSIVNGKITEIIKYNNFPNNNNNNYR